MLPLALIGTLLTASAELTAVGLAGGGVELRACAGFVRGFHSGAPFASWAPEETATVEVFSDADVRVVIRNRHGREACVSSGSFSLLAGESYEIYVLAARPNTGHPVVLTTSGRKGAQAAWDAHRGRRVDRSAFSPVASRWLDPYENTVQFDHTRPMPAFVSATKLLRLAGTTDGLLGADGHPSLLAAQPQHWLHFETDGELVVPEGVVITVRRNSVTEQHAVSTLINFNRGDDAELFVTSTTADRLVPYTLVFQTEAHRLAQGEPAVFAPKPLLDHGALASAAGVLAEQRARAEMIRAVVRLTDGGKHVCSGTLVRFGDELGVVTAAHCLFTLSLNGEIRARRQTLVADRAVLRLEEARLGDGFEQCAENGARYSDCSEGGAADAAFIPVSSIDPGVTPWRTCESEPNRSEITIFGYGLDRGRLPRQLLLGHFETTGAGGENSWLAESATQLVQPGDSGGPAIDALENMQLGDAAPAVCFVTAAFKRDRDEERASALLTPAWRLRQR